MKTIRKNKKINWLFAGIISILCILGCEHEDVMSYFRDNSVTPDYWTFSDSFDRTDGSIGNGWVEIVEAVGYSGSSGIVSMQYRSIVSYSTSTYRRVRIARALPNYEEITTIEVSLKMHCGVVGLGIPHNNDSLKVLLFADNVNRDSATQGIGFHIVGGDRSDTGDGAFRTVITVDGVESTQGTDGNLNVWRQIDFVASDDTIKLFNYPYGDTRPDIPTITVPYAGYTPQFTNIVAWFTCAQVGDNAAGTTIDDLSISINGFIE